MRGMSAARWSAGVEVIRRYLDMSGLFSAYKDWIKVKFSACSHLIIGFEDLQN